MEGRLEQLVVIAVVVVLSLFDLLLRWAKRRAKRQPTGMPEEDDGEPAFEDAAFEAAPQELVFARAAHAWTPPRAAGQLPGAAEHPPQCRRRAPGPGAARRGIVLMTLLGPCRAMEVDRQEQPRSSGRC